MTAPLALPTGSAAACLSLPTARVPVPAKVGRVERHDNFVPEPRLDLVVAAGAPVGLDGLVRLHVPDLDGVAVRVRRDHEKKAQPSRIAMTTNAVTTIAMSVLRLTRVR